MTSTAVVAAALAAFPAAPRSDTVSSAPRCHPLLGLTVAWVAVGLAVTAGVSFLAGVDFLPVQRLSVLSAVVGEYSAYASAHLVSPLLARLPSALRLTVGSHGRS